MKLDTACQVMCPVQKHPNLRQGVQLRFFYIGHYAVASCPTQNSALRLTPRRKCDSPSDSFHVGKGSFLTPWAGLY